MALSRNTRLMGMLALTLAATWYAAGIDQPEDLLAEPGDRTAVADTRGPTAPARRVAPVTAAEPAAPAAPPAPSALRLSPRGQDLFAVRSWQPTPPVAAPAPVMKPVAPPLPFRYLGRLEEDGQVAVFVSDGTATRVLRQGETVSNYRVEEINAQGMRLIYLPLNETQRLLFESKN